MKQSNHRVVTFKADATLIESLQDVPNRSEFIRSAIIAALEGACPLCKGTGILTSSQQKHWREFARNHPVEECNDCHERHLVCEKERKGKTSK
ncbi:MAG: CopG family transcriptional regulator [Candidatus Sumerlaeota bacterium]